MRQRSRSWVKDMVRELYLYWQDAHASRGLLQHMVMTRHAATLQGSGVDVLCISVQMPRPGRQGAAAKVQGKTQQLLSRPMAQIIQDINEQNLRKAVQQSKTLEGVLDEEQDSLLQQALQESAQEAACAGVTESDHVIVCLRGRGGHSMVSG